MRWRLTFKCGICGNDVSVYYDGLPGDTPEIILSRDPEIVACMCSNGHLATYRAVTAQNIGKLYEAPFA